MPSHSEIMFYDCAAAVLSKNICEIIFFDCTAALSKISATDIASNDKSKRNQIFSHKPGNISIRHNMFRKPNLWQ